MNITTILKGGVLRQHRGKITLGVSVAVLLAAYLTGDLSLTDLLQQVLPLLAAQ